MWICTGTFGVLTSVTVKAFPQTPVVSGSIRFSTKPQPGSNDSISTETFWTGMKTYWTHALSIPAAGGLGYNFIYPEASPSGLTFTVSISLPNHSLAQYRAIIQPLLTDLNTLGIRVPMPTSKRSYAHDHNPYPPHTHHPLSKRGGVPGEITGHTLLSSRLFPRSSFTPSSLNTTHAAIRHAVESGGYTFHGMNYAPPLPPIDSAITPYCTHKCTNRMHTGTVSPQSSHVLPFPNHIKGCRGICKSGVTWRVHRAGVM
jgi:hypothetical protein